MRKYKSVFDLYDDIEIYSKSLDSLGGEINTCELRDAIEFSSTGTEILMKLSKILKNHTKNKKIPPETRKQAKHLLSSCKSFLNYD